MVADMHATENFYVWVRTDSRFKKPSDLKGAKVSVTRFGGVAHAYGRFLAKSLNLEKDIRFIASGGVRQEVAGLKSGVDDGAILSSFVMGPLKLAKEARELLALRDYLPKEWTDVVVFAHRDLAKNKPEVVKKGITGLLKGGQFVIENRAWAIEKMKSYSRYAQSLAEFLYDTELR